MPQSFIKDCQYLVKDNESSACINTDNLLYQQARARKILKKKNLSLELRISALEDAMNAILKKIK